MTAAVAFESFRQAWLTDVRAGDPSTTELGHRFARKLLTQWREIEDSSDDLVYCDGAGDGGIDIAYLDRGDGEEDGENTEEGDTWFLVQSKYGSAFRGTSTLIEESQKVIDTLDGQRERLSSLVENLLERLTTFRRQASSRDRVVLVLATEEELNDPQKRALNDIRAMGHQRFGALFEVEAVSVATIFQRNLDEASAAPAPRITLPLHADLVPSGEALLIGSVSLLALYNFLRAYRVKTEDLDQLYEKNVRRFLGPRRNVNKNMRQTLQDTPERFGLYNNGITLVVANFRRDDTGMYTLMDPYIVNGCQTTRTIWDVFHARLEAGGTGSDPALETWRQKAAQGVVVTKVVKVGAGDYGDDELKLITRWTNSQNAVRPQDFITLEPGPQSWPTKMAERYNVFLEVQRGGWDSQRALQNRNPGKPRFDPNHWANAFSLIKVYGAGWLGEAGTAFGKNAPFVPPNGSIYKKIMSNDEGGGAFGVDDLYAAYRLQEAADKYNFGRSAEKPTRRQTRFLFYMVVIELLRGVMIRAVPAMPTKPKDLTQALIKLFDPANDDVVKRLLDNAVDLIDEYMTPNTQDCVLNEPTFKNDINAYLKGEQLGKEQSSPCFRSQLSVQQRQLGKAGKGETTFGARDDHRCNQLNNIRVLTETAIRETRSEGWSGHPA